MIKCLDVNDGNMKLIMKWELIGYWDLHVSLFSCGIIYVYLYIFSLDY